MPGRFDLTGECARAREDHRDPNARRHAERCASCASALRDAERLRAALRRAADAEPVPATLRLSVVARIRAAAALE